MSNYIIPSDNWEQQQEHWNLSQLLNYIIPSDNWEQQPVLLIVFSISYYIIPSDNWEQQLPKSIARPYVIISYQAITGNNNEEIDGMKLVYCIIDI